MRAARLLAIVARALVLATPNPPSTPPPPLTPPPPVAAARNGPGLLVTWAPSPGALEYHVLRARSPSPSFYGLLPDCCPLLPTLVRPCCPASAHTHSLQVEGLDAGVAYRFHVIAAHGSWADNVLTRWNVSVGFSGWVSAATVPAAPGAPELTLLDGLLSLAWAPPPSDGGDVVRGYRLWADVSSLNTSGLVLVANTSAGRQQRDAHLAAAPSLSALALLPSHTYQLSVQALNALGGGPLSEAVRFEAPDAPPAQYEVMPGAAWRRGRVARGGVARHRVYVPEGTEHATILVQQAAAAGASLAERRRQTRVSELHLYAQVDGAPDAPFDAEPGGVFVDPRRVREWQLSYHRMMNTSARHGELSLSIAQPAARWIYLLLHGAAVEKEAAEYDVHVSAAVGAGTAGMSSARRADHDLKVASGWRYQVDPEGPTTFDSWVVARALHPMA